MKKLINEIKLTMVVLGIALCTSSTAYAKDFTTTYRPTDVTSNTNTTISQATLDIINTETSVNPNYVTSNSFKLYINGEPKDIENTYAVVADRTFLPMREVANLLGADVDWNSKYNVAILETDDTLIEVPIGRTRASVNNEIKDLGNTRSLKVETSAGGVTYLPLRFLAENLGYNVKYYSDTSVIHIYNTETEPEINSAVANTVTNNNTENVTNNSTNNVKDDVVNNTTNNNTATKPNTSTPTVNDNVTNNNTTTPTQPTTSAKTEEQVIAKINELKAKYPENSQWETSDIYNNTHDYKPGFYDSMTYGAGSYKMNITLDGKIQYAKDCAAWAMWVSDQIFGNAPATKHSNYNAIKVGDLIHEGEDGNSTNGSHWSVVVGMGYNDMNEKYYIVTDSDDTRYVNWETHTLAEWCYNPDYPRTELDKQYLGEYGETGVPFQVYSRY